MKKTLKRNTTDMQCAGLVASIGCPRRLEICNEFGRKLSRRRMFYRTEAQARQRDHDAAAAAGWVF